MNLQRRTTDDAIHFHVEGQLNALSADELKQAFFEVPDDGSTDVVLELDDLELIDSSGAGVVVWLFKRLRRSGADLYIQGLTGQPKVVFNLLGLNRVFKVA